MNEIDAKSEMDNLEVRNLERVNRVLDNAKLKKEELKNTTQLLSFSSDVAENNLLLLELDATLLDHVTNGEPLTFRGNDSDHAVLCTKNRTYTVKEAETSNSLLLLNELTFPKEVIDDGGTEQNLVSRQVVGVRHTYLEVTPCKPRLRIVREILERNKYLGREHELDNKFQNFTTDDLLDKVQASEKELLVCLRNNEAYEIEGYWRLLDFDYNCRIMMHILNLLEENSWSYKDVPRGQVLDTLEELEPRSILEQCLDYHVVSSSTNNTTFCCLDENKICCFFAEIMLKQAGKFNLQEFCDSWKQCVPDGMTAHLDQLQGLVLIDRTCSPEVISLFPIYEMPEDINGRFNYLFKTRTKWTFEDISPFIKDLTTETLDVNALLTKYSRVSTINGVRQYTSKRPLY